jgi:hypothetical protein
VHERGLGDLEEEVGRVRTGFPDLLFDEGQQVRGADRGGGEVRLDHSPAGCSKSGGLGDDPPVDLTDQPVLLRYRQEAAGQDDVVVTLRIEAGRNPLDRELSDLVGELATRSDAFRTRWARHNVRHHRTTPKRIHNTVVGDLTLTGDALELPGEDLMLIYLRRARRQLGKGATRLSRKLEREPTCL